MFSPESAKKRFFWLLLGVVGGSVGAWRLSETPQAEPALTMPAPVEVLLVDEKHKAARKKWRKAWFKELHRAPPETDWKEIERENGLRNQKKRNALAGRRDAPSGRWSERGSQNQAGRAHVGTYSLDKNTLYMGSSLGGVWKGTASGAEWEPIGDNLYGGAHWLQALSPEVETDPDILLAGTDGGLLHTSHNQGQTWEVPVGIPEYTVGLRRLVVTSEGSEAVFLVLQAWDWGTYRYDYFLYRSVDKGQNIQKIRDLGAYGADIWVPRDGSGGLYLVQNNLLEYSEDLGESWEVRGLIPGNDTRAELAGSEAGAPRLWAVVPKGGGYEIFRSDDAGYTWESKQNIASADTYSMYWNTLDASRINVDLFAHGGMEFFYTRDGGISFTKMNDWGSYYDSPQNQLHADIMGIDVKHDASGNEVWFISTDGGLYQSTDGLATVSNLSLDGMRISQYYSTHTSVENPDLIAAGAQDQGYQTTGHFLGNQGDGYLEFEQVISGDYGHIVSPDGTHKRLYAVYPGVIGVFDGDAPSRVRAWAYPPDAESSRYYAWIMPLEADPSDPDSVFACFTRLYRYTREGRSWVATQWSTQDFAEHDYEYLSAFRLAPSNPDRAYAATSYGQVYVSDDMGITWIKSLSDDGPDSHYFYGSALVVDPLNENTVYLGGSGYDGPAVYRSVDGGRSWVDWSSGLPATLVYDLAITANGTVFAAGEQAAYRRTPNDVGWVDITSNEAPITTYWSVEYVAGVDVARFGTYGRGIWDYLVTDDSVGDGDGDGYGVDVDCNDGDVGVHPNAEEICEDGVDQDCNGVDLECPVDTSLPGSEGDSTDVPPVEENQPEKKKEKECGCDAGGPAGLSSVLVIGLLFRKRSREA